jgi:signal transduction histidine kinase
MPSAGRWSGSPRRTGIDARYRTVGTVGELPTVLEVVLLRAVQEALSNVRKHAAARSVTVVLRFTSDSVAVSVVDDGVGFAVGGSGYGLSGMLARVEQVSGTLVVHSVPGNGTRLELEVPR